MWTEATIIILVLWVYGFWKHREWLKNYFKNWWWMMKIAWRGKKNE